MKNNVFPVIESTLSPQHLAKWVAEEYGFINVSCHLLRAYMNHTYSIVTKSEQYVLRIYNHSHRSELQVNEEVRLLDSIKNEVNVSNPMPDKGGNLVKEVNAPEGKRYAVLFSFAIGSNVRYSTVELNRQIGVEVGRLHLATNNRSIQRDTYTIERLIGWSYNQITKYISSDLEEIQLIKNSEAVLSDIFSEYTLKSGVVHLDIWYSNMAVHDDGSVTIYDFDCIGNGPLVLDIGYYCMQLFFVESDKNEYEKKKTAFIAGYRSEFPITDKELGLIPYAGFAIWVYYLGVQAQRYDNFANHYYTENYIKMMIDRVKGWLAYHNIALK